MTTATETQTTDENQSQTEGQVQENQDTGEQSQQEPASPGMFDDEAGKLTEEQLAGEQEAETEAETETKPEKKAEAETLSTETEVVDPIDSLAAAEKTGEETEQKFEKPPSGYVPKQALDEERTKRQSLSSELYQARQKIAAFESKKAESIIDPETENEFKDFKILSQKEFDELADEDPFEGTKYLRKEALFKEHQRQEQDKETREQQAESMRQQVIKDSVDEIDRVAPGIWDPETGVGEELTETAAGLGVSKQIAGILSNPGTVIIDPQSGQKMVLGQGAAEFVGMVKAISDQSRGSDPVSVRKEIEDRVTKEVTERVTKELTEKFKTGSAGVVSLGDASSHSEQVKGAVGGSEEEWARMSDEDRRIALGG